MGNIFETDSNRTLIMRITVIEHIKEHINEAIPDLWMSDLYSTVDANEF